MSRASTTESIATCGTGAESRGIIADLTTAIRPIGMGAMRLSTARDRDDARSVEVLHAAFDAGVTFVDTSDAYAQDDTEIGHNERLIARALGTWSGDRSRVVVATKGGLTRPGGRWLADGRARHLAAACEASRRGLDVERIALYQLHAPDPRTPLATSVRALDRLKRDGLVESVGLCNVNLRQLEEARAITAIDAVQVELGFWEDGALLERPRAVLRRAGHPRHRAPAVRRAGKADASPLRSGVVGHRRGARRHAARDRARVAPRSVGSHLCPCPARAGETGGSIAARRQGSSHRLPTARDSTNACRRGRWCVSRAGRSEDRPLQ